MKSTQVKVAEPSVKTSELPEIETKTINHKSETSSTEKGNEKLLTEIQEKVLNKRILRKLRNFWKLGIKEFSTQYFGIY